MIGKSPIGEWELALPNTEEMRKRFGGDDNNDNVGDICSSLATLAGHRIGRIDREEIIPVFYSRRVGKRV